MCWWKAMLFLLAQKKPSTEAGHIYRSIATTMSQLKTCDFSRQTFKGFGYNFL
jgi:hypothetical protein